jgi:Domain of unknown function (DUF6457)
MGEMNELDAWVAAASAELGLTPADVQAKAVLDVARDVAHQVLRPGAPVTAYLMGVAVGRGADPAQAAARISALAQAWAARAEAAEGRGSGEPRGERTEPQRGSADHRG